MFEGLPVEVQSLLRPDGGVVVPAACVGWLESKLRETLSQNRGTPSLQAVALLKALTVGAERFEGSAVGTRMFESGRIVVGEVSKPFLTSLQAAELTERSDRGIRKACESGRLRAVKFGSVWHISPKDLESYVYRKDSSDGEIK